MAHEAPPETRSTRHYWLLVGVVALSLLTVLVVSHLASAEAVAGTCSAVSTTNGVATRSWYFGAGDTSGAGSVTCSTSTDTLHTLTAGGSSTCPASATCSIVLKCRETTAAGAPVPATTLTLLVYADNTAFGSPSTSSQIWTASPSGNLCTSSQSFTVWCTSDGTSTGSPRHGTLRLVLRAQNTNVPTYDVNTDSNGQWGIYRCNARITAFTDGNPTTSPSVYVAGDTLRTSLTTTSSAYTGSSNVRIDIACSTGTNTAGTLTLTNGAATVDTTLKGTSSAYPDDCSLTQKAIITTTSSISGLTTQPLFEWDTASPPTIVTFSSTTQATKSTGKTLDRTPVATSCRLDAGSETGITIIGRGKTLALRCTWTDARGTALPNAGLAIAYTHRSSQPLTDTTDLASVNAAFGASGLLTYSPATTATSTDTNGTAPLDYVESIEQYGASRTSSELLNYGTSSGVFDVSGVLDVTDILTWRNVCNGATLATTFWTNHETVCSREGPAHDPRGNIIATSLTFTRTYTTTGASLPTDSESGVTTGTSSAHYTPASPPSGTWTYTVTVTDGLGNTGTRSKTLTFSDTMPADEATAGGDDPVRVSAGYSWDTARMSVSATSSYTNGTRRQGAADLFTVLVIAPDNTTAVANLTMTESPPGVYSGAWNPGTPPMLGTWTITTSVWQPDMVDRAVASVHLTISVNASQRFADQYALTQTLWASVNQSTLDASMRSTYSNALLNATMAYTWSLENATLAQHLSDTSSIIAALRDAQSAANNSRIANAADMNTTLARLAGNNTAAFDALNATLSRLAGNTTSAFDALNLTISLLAGNVSAGFDVISLQIASAEANATMRHQYAVAQADLNAATSLAAQAYTDSLINLTRADIASFRNHVDDRFNETEALINATSTNTSSRSDTVSIHVDGDHGPDVYAGRITTFNATIDNGTSGKWGTLLLVWDMGDASTATGPTVYHRYAPGTYDVTLRAVDALGATTTATTTVTVLTSTPIANITGGEGALQFHLLVFDGSGSHDPHDDIATYHWEVDPLDVQTSWWGTPHLNAGNGDGKMFNTTILGSGDHTIRLTVTNTQGVTNTTNLALHVGDVYGISPAPSTPVSGTDLGTSVTRGVEGGMHGIEKMLHFVQWIFG